MEKSTLIEVSIARVFAVLLQLVFLKIYTTHTSLYELGMYYFLFTASYSINAFLLVPLDYFQQSQIYKLKSENASLKSLLTINLWILKIMVVILALAIGVCLAFRYRYLVVIAIIIILAVSTYAVNLMRGIINNLEDRRSAIYTLIIENVLKVLLFYLLGFAFGYSAATILASTLCASIAILVILYIIVMRLPEFKLNKIKVFNLKEIVFFSYPISVAAVINWIQLQGYRMILVPLGLIEIVGVYGTVANVGTSGMNAFSTIYSQLFTPRLYKSNGEYLSMYLKYAIISILGILVFSYVLSDYIILLLTKLQFVRYSSLIIYGVLAEGGNLLISALTVYLTIKNLTNITVRSSITGLIAFAVSFSFIYLIGQVSVNTIGIPIVFTQIVITTYLVLIVRKIKEGRV